MKWKIEDTGKSSAHHNMLYDAILLRHAKSYKHPVLRFYDWILPSATFGYFINPSDFFNEDAIDAKKIEIARRPTGGGILFHTSDFVFSILIPSSHSAYSNNTLQNYATINNTIAQAIQRCFPSIQTKLLIHQSPYQKTAPFCMANPTKYDILIDGKKVGGAAQRRTKEAILHQGTISLSHPDYEWIASLLKSNPALIQKMETTTLPLFESKIMSPKQANDAKASIKSAITETFLKYPILS